MPLMYYDLYDFFRINIAYVNPKAYYIKPSLTPIHHFEGETHPFICYMWLILYSYI